MLVFDSSTLILITRIELLDLFLKAIGMEVAVPEAVRLECCAGKKIPDGLTIRKAIQESRIKARSVRSSKLAEKLRFDFNLGLGESEAIALAIERKAQLVAIDDKHGINACKLAGIPFTTALAILLRTAEKGLIDRDDAIARLAALGMYGRYKEPIIASARRELEKLP